MAEQSTPTNAGATFSEQALGEYREILEHYPQRRAALMPVLWLAQREFGWISPEIILYVASLMELPVAWVEGAVSFYTMYYRKPIGRHHLQVCTNLSCQLRGADEVLSALRRKLAIDPGETTPDSMFSLDRAECLGSCGTAPVVQLGSGPFVENVSVDRALKLIDDLSGGLEIPLEGERTKGDGRG